MSYFFKPLERLQGLKGLAPVEMPKLSNVDLVMPELNTEAQSNTSTSTSSNQSFDLTKVGSAPTEATNDVSKEVPKGEAQSEESTIANIPKFANILAKAKDNPIAQKIDTYFNSKYGRDVADKMVAIAEMEGGWKAGDDVVADSIGQSFSTFQINLDVHKDKVAKYTGTTDKTANAKWLSNIDNSIKIADEVYQESGFKAWTPANKSIKTFLGVLGNGIVDFDELKPTAKIKETTTQSSNRYFDLSGIKVKDQVEWGAKFAEPPAGLLDLVKSPTVSNTTNSATTYRNVPAGTSAFNVSQNNGKQINFGADLAVERGTQLVNPFEGKAKVVKPLGLSGAGNAVRLEYTNKDGSKIYADLNHNEKNLVKVGQVVEPNQAVAIAGDSGNTSTSGSGSKKVHSDFTLYIMDGNKPVYFDTSSKFR